MTIQQVLEGRVVELMEVPELQAIPIDPKYRGEADLTEAAAAVETGAADLAADYLTREDREAFAEAGLLITPAGEEDLFAAAVLAPQGPAVASHRIFVGPRRDGIVETPRVTVKADARLSEQEARAKLEASGVEIVRTLRFAENLFEVVSRTPGELALELAKRLREQPAVEFAEAQVLCRTPQRFRPSDPEYARQWQWQTMGMENAWSKTRGAGARVAVVDLGMEVSHPDLAGGLHGGGHFPTSGVSSPPFVPRGSEAGGFPSHPHGTLCMSLIGARLNGIDGCGGAPESQLVPVAVAPGRLATQTDLARAIAYATDPSTEDPRASAADGADVISCSLGAPQAYALGPTLELALEFAVNKGRGGRGTPVFWAVQNFEEPIRNDQICAHPTTIAVGMASRYDLSAGSAFGPELDFLAPGLNVCGPGTGGEFGCAELGASYATACAAAVAALVLSRERRLPWRVLRDRLHDACDPVGRLPYVDGRNDYYGHGRINAALAVGA